MMDKDKVAESVIREFAEIHRRRTMGMVSELHRRNEVARKTAKTYSKVAGEMLVTGRGSRSDNEFRWVSLLDPTMEEWRKVASAFMEATVSTIAGKRTSINGLFEHLIEHPELPRDPAEYCEASRNLPVYQPSSLQYVGMLFGFFEFVLEARCKTVTENGVVHIRPGCANPFRRQKGEGARLESHRSPMPMRYVRMLLEILTENDFEWPKTFNRRRGPRKREDGGDRFLAINPDTGVEEKVWSPVLTIALILKLLLPARSFQIRMLDSGEADSERYEAGRWVKNTGPLAPPANKRVRRGVFRKSVDPRDGVVRTHLRFNTNKTGDLGKGPDEAGYVMPWESKEALHYLEYLRDWQEKWNPISMPTPWKDLEVNDITRRMSAVELESRGAACFLFRDPVSAANPAFPISNGNLQVAWKRLCGELQRRLDRLAAEDSEETVFPPVMRNPELRMCNRHPVYDLHTLRVTRITAWAQQGVPPEVLMKVVGHSSIIMTIYYQKFAAAHIHDRMSEAEAGIQREEQLDWKRHLGELDQSRLLEKVAFNHPSGLDSLCATHESGWIVSDYGLCTAGGLRCDEGGEKLASAGYGIWGAVPSTPSKCSLCRFFLSGPVFLDGLVARFNAVGFHLREASVRFQKAREQVEGTEARIGDAKGQGTPIPQVVLSGLDAAITRLDQTTMEVDDLAKVWNALHRLVQQSLAIVRKESGAAEAIGDEDGDGDWVEKDVEGGVEDWPLQGSPADGKGAEESAVGEGVEDSKDGAARKPGGKGDGGSATSSGGYVLVGTRTSEEMEICLRETTGFDLEDRICRSSVIYPGIDVSGPNLHRMRAFDSLLSRSGVEPFFFSLTPEEGLIVGNQMSEFLQDRLGSRDSILSLMEEREEAFAELGLNHGSFVALIEEAIQSIAPKSLSLAAAGPRIGTSRLRLTSEDPS